jgi:feruloyl esterase
LNRKKRTPKLIAYITYEELINYWLPEVLIEAAMIYSETTSYCQVLATIGKEIDFELLLPVDWNGRFLMGGGGGFVGSIANDAKWSVHSGYATSGTNTGHKGHGLKANWALEIMERQVNFGHLTILQAAILDQCYEMDGLDGRLGRKWQSP